MGTYALRGMPVVVEQLFTKRLFLFLLFSRKKTLKMPEGEISVQ